GDLVLERGRQCLLACCHFLDDDGRRHAVADFTCRVDGGHAVDCCKPELTVCTSPGRWLRATAHFRRTETIVASISDVRNRLDATGGEGLEVVLLDPSDALIAPEPEPSLPAVQDLENVVVEDSVVRAGTRDARPIHATESASLRADPERSAFVFVEREDDVARESLRSGEGRGAIRPHE